MFNQHFSLITLQEIWGVALMLLIAGYAILDGFDLGVGILHLFSKKDEERRLMLNSIGPVWDGNEVWLVTAGGALFAGFPDVYATLCTAFYMPLMLLLSGLIFRAVAIEFRSKQPMAWWRWMWDLFFTFASLLIAFLLGVVMGNLIQGLPLNSAGDFTGDLFGTILHPYNCLMGIMTVALFTMHGSIYLMMKTEGNFHERMRQWVNPSIIAFIICYAVVTMATLIYMPHMTDKIRQKPEFFLLAVLNMLCIANIPREIHKGRDGRAFISSCFNILFLMLLYSLGTFPNLVRASNNPMELSLTLFNASSSAMTLEILLLIAIIGMPLVCAYTFMIYWIFHGKVKLDATSY